MFLQTPSVNHIHLCEKKLLPLGQGTMVIALEWGVFIFTSVQIHQEIGGFLRQKIVKG